MVADGRAQVPAVGQGEAHQGRVAHRVAVVAEGHYAGGHQLLHVGQLPAGPVAGYAADYPNPHGRGGGAVRHVVHHGGVVDGRVGVGHGADGGEAAPGRRRRAGGNGLLVLEPRLPQVGVDVDEAGSDHQAGRVDNPGVRFNRIRVNGRRNRLDSPILDQDVGYRINPVGRVDDAAAGDERGRGVGGRRHGLFRADARPHQLVQLGHAYGHAVGDLFPQSASVRRGPGRC